jgi:pimeloyl-ACP methyl ester carboxylesterase
VTDHWSAGLAATQLKAFKARFRTNPTITLQRFLALISRHCAVNTLACLQAHASQQTINYPLLNRLLDWLLALNGCPLIARLTQPGLHILADRDPLIPQQTAQHIQLLNPQQQAMRLRQVGHTPFISHSRQIAQLINDFDNDRLG